MRVYVWVCVSMSVCMGVCKWVRVCMGVCKCVRVCMGVCKCTCTCVCYLDGKYVILVTVVDLIVIQYSKSLDSCSS